MPYIVLKQMAVEIIWEHLSKPLHPCHALAHSNISLCYRILSPDSDFTTSRT